MSDNGLSFSSEISIILRDINGRSYHIAQTQKKRACIKINDFCTLLQTKNKNQLKTSTYIFILITKVITKTIIPEYQTESP